MTGWNCRPAAISSNGSRRHGCFPTGSAAFKKALASAGVGIASLLPMYRWASNDEAERQAAVKHWKRAIEIAVELGVDTMNSEFGRGPHPDKGGCYCCHTGSMIEACEDAWWRSMEELVPVLEREGITLHVEPHPEDWCETLQPALDIIRTVNSPTGAVPLLRAAYLLFRRRHPRHAARGKRRAGPCPCRRHLQPQGQFRPALYPESPGTQARVHQHLNIGQGEVPWDDFFGTLHEIGFDGIMTACVFAWEDKADASGTFMRAEMQRYIDKFWK
jgi:myo-inositol catabolism protein IolH